MEKRGRSEGSVVACVERLLRSTQNSTRPISTARTMADARALLPQCEHTDDELETVVAMVALVARRNVAFDRAYTGIGADAIP